MTATGVHAVLPEITRAWSVDELGAAALELGLYPESLFELSVEPA